MVDAAWRRAVLVIAAAGLAGCGAGSGGAAPRASPPTSETAATSAAPVRSQFALLRRPRTRADDLPPRADLSFLASAGLDARSSRRARRDRGRGLFLVAGTTRACLYLGNRYGGYFCGTVRELSAGRLGLAAYLDRGATTVVRFLPDGAHDVVVDMGAGVRRRLAVRANAILFHAPGDTVAGRIAWRDAAGRRHRDPFP
jgi:hypothetical protein